MTEQTFGSKAQVWHGTAKKTSGGLTKSDLMKNKHGRIVSRRKHSMGKKSIKHLRKLGYIAKKGKFTLFHKGRKSRKMRGGTGNAVGTGVQGSPLGNAMAGVSRPLQSATPSQIAASMSKSGGSRRRRGGSPYGSSFSPTEVSGMGNGSGVALQFVASNSS